MFSIADEAGYRDILPGIRMKTLVWGECTLMTEFRLEPGASLPSHDHPHEQTGYLVSGCLRLFIGDESRVIGPGDSWVIPGRTSHRAEAIDSSVAVEVFSPVREDYLP
ncbi:MAG: cupin domain-containing protein [Desulfobacterales bacterium]